MTVSLPRRMGAELVGTMLLLAGIVGSGIMAERLAGGSEGLALLANSLATGALLMVLILMFAPVSGAHLNPIVSLTAASEGFLWSEVFGYAAAQVLGAFLGVALAHAMFALPLLQIATKARAADGLLVSEVVATFGLLLTIRGVARARPAWVPVAVAAYVVSAYWFTSSTSFANPAVTCGRMLTDTFTGIRPADTLGFLGAQCLGGGLAVGLSRFLFAPAPD